MIEQTSHLREPLGEDLRHEHARVSEMRGLLELERDGGYRRGGAEGSVHSTDRSTDIVISGCANTYAESKCACPGWRVSATSPCSAFLILSSANLSRHTSMPMPRRAARGRRSSAPPDAPRGLQGAEVVVVDDDLPREDFGELLERKLHGLYWSRPFVQGHTEGEWCRRGPRPQVWAWTRHGWREGQARCPSGRMRAVVQSGGVSSAASGQLCHTASVSGRCPLPVRSSWTCRPARSSSKRVLPSAKRR